MAVTDAREQLLDQIRTKAVVHGRVVLSSGREADYYVDLRRVTLDGQAAPLVGEVMLDLTSDLSYDAVGGLTLGRRPGGHRDAARRRRARAGTWTPSWCARRRRPTGCSGGSRARTSPGRRVLAVEDTSTTGGSVLTAVEALREAGAEVVGVAVIVERGAAGMIAEAGLEYRAAYQLADLGLD